MTFTKKGLRLVSVRTISKGDKDYTFVKLADTATFENNDFMLSKDCNVKDLAVGSDYDCILDIEGKFSTVMLEPPKKG